MKKVKITTITLIIALITMVSFIGVYVKKQNRMENKVKEYSTAMDIKGSRRVTLQIVEETEENEEAKTEEASSEDEKENNENTEASNQEQDKTVDYKKAKKILEKRLKVIGVKDYIVRQNNETGEIIAEIPEDEMTDTAVSYLGTVGKFEIKDATTDELLMDNNDIKLSNVLYGQDSSSGTAKTAVYLNIEFTKEGAKKFEEISKKYVPIESDETTENNAEEEAQTEENINEEEKKENKIKVLIDGEELISTNFEEPVTTGKLQMTMGQASTDSKTIQGYASQASNIAIILDNGNLPLKYEVKSNQYVMSGVSEKTLSIIIYVMAVVVVALLVVLIIRYKAVGAIIAISTIGLISTLLLVIRYANVVISINGILGVMTVIVLNYLFTIKLLSKLKDKKITKENISESIKQTYKEFFIRIIPICILSVVFCFIKLISINSFGMVMFWGISLIALYNFIVTKNMLKLIADK
ncbi:MAG: hypothetical protein HUJ68_00480 [Clostridia bacterium]|nr:hypothetical protein [Clostridia bacterium]